MEGIIPSEIMGVIECSIGKMVPVVKDSDLKEDPLLLFAEEYNSPILDEKGFLTECTDIGGIQAAGNIQAYVDRKLYRKTNGVPVFPIVVIFNFLTT